MAGHLTAAGIRVPRSRLRASLHRVDGDGIANRRRRTIRRRVYSVEGPNSLWHIDGNHKLIRWRLVVHGGIDGFSRLIVYMGCAPNNKAETVNCLFTVATLEFGLPEEIRSDGGGENVDVWRNMVTQHGDNSVAIVGSSTHNERIERLWVDVARSVIRVFARSFRDLEGAGALNPLNEVDIYCLHYIFLPRINRCLHSFVESWNHHRISTERSMTPYQLFLGGSSGVTFPDYSLLSPTCVTIPQMITHVHVPRSTFHPCAQLLHNLNSAIDPLSPCQDFGKALYQQTVTIVGTHVSTCTQCMV